MTDTLQAIIAEMRESVLATSANDVRAWADRIEAATRLGEMGAGEVVAWLHDVVQDDGAQDQALSFSRDSFPLEGVGGFRSLRASPLYTRPPDGWVPEEKPNLWHTVGDTYVGDVSALVAAAEADGWNACRDAMLSASPPMPQAASGGE